MDPLSTGTNPYGSYVLQTFRLYYIYGFSKYLEAFKNGISRSTRSKGGPISSSVEAANTTLKSCPPHSHKDRL